MALLPPGDAASDRVGSPSKLEVADVTHPLMPEGQGNTVHNVDIF